MFTKSCWIVLCSLVMLFGPCGDAEAMRVPQSYTQALEAYREAAANYDMTGLQRAVQLAKLAMNAPEADMRLIEARSHLRRAEIFQYNREPQQSADALRAAAIALMRADRHKPRFTPSEEFLATKVLIAVIAQEQQQSALFEEYRAFDPLTALPVNSDNGAVLYARLRAVLSNGNWQTARKLVKRLQPQWGADNPELQAINAYIDARLEPKRLQESINRLSAILRDHPNHRLARFYRGKLQ